MALKRYRHCFQNQFAVVRLFQVLWSKLTDHWSDRRTSLKIENFLDIIKINTKILPLQSLSISGEWKLDSVRMLKPSGSPPWPLEDSLKDSKTTPPPKE